MRAYRAIAQEPVAPPLDGAAPVAIELDGLTKTYGRGAAALTAVDDVTLKVAPDQVFGLLGPNGAGSPDLGRRYRASDRYRRRLEQTAQQGEKLSRRRE